MKKRYDFTLKFKVITLSHLLKSLLRTLFILKGVWTQIYAVVHNAIDWEQILTSSKNFDEKAKDAIDAVNSVANKHVPYKLASRKKQKLLDKSRITPGILKSI